VGNRQFDILHLASLARCGETLFQRTFSVHTDLHVVHDLYKENSSTENALFSQLSQLPVNHIALASLNNDIDSNQIKFSASKFFLKQGVFAPRHRFTGIGLLRNPLSVFLSLWNYDAKISGQAATTELNTQYWHQYRLPRILAWVENMQAGWDKLILQSLDPVTQFLTFYRLRAAQIMDAVDTIIFYETFLAQPETEIRRVCTALGIEFQPQLLHANTFFSPGQIGHGGTDLGAPIRQEAVTYPTHGIAPAPFKAAAAALGLDIYC